MNMHAQWLIHKLKSIVAHSVGKSVIPTTDDTYVRLWISKGKQRQLVSMH